MGINKCYTATFKFQDLQYDEKIGNGAAAHIFSAGESCACQLNYGRRKM